MKNIFNLDRSKPEPQPCRLPQCCRRLRCLQPAFHLSRVLCFSSALRNRISFALSWDTIRKKRSTHDRPLVMRGTPPGKVINPWLECSMLNRLPPGWTIIKKNLGFKAKSYSDCPIVKKKSYRFAFSELLDQRNIIQPVITASKQQFFTHLG